MLSPNVYFLQNNFYNTLSEKMKCKLILDTFSSKENSQVNGKLAMPNFIQNFDYLFEDQEYRFRGDKTLKTMILSSLTLEFVRSKESIIEINVSSKIYFIDKGKINVYYKDIPHKLLSLEQGSYFGDISLIFRVQNNFRYCSSYEQSTDEYARIYSINHKILQVIFDRYPDFYNLCKVRAIRKQHHYKQVKNG